MRFENCLIVFFIFYVIIIACIICDKEMLRLDCKASEQFDSICINSSRVGNAFAEQYCAKFGKLQGQKFIPECWKRYADTYGGAYCTRTPESWKSDVHCEKLKYCRACRSCAERLRTNQSRFDIKCSLLDRVFKEFAIDYCLSFAERGDLSITSCELFREYREMQKGLRLVASRRPSTQGTDSVMEEVDLVWIDSVMDEEQQQLRHKFWTLSSSDSNRALGHALELKSSRSYAFADMFESSDSREEIWSKRLLHIHWNRPSELQMVLQDDSEVKHGVDAVQTWLEAVTESVLRLAFDDQLGLGDLVDGSTQTWPKFLFDAVSTAGLVIPSQPPLQSSLPKIGVLPENASICYHFLGEWLARAYIVDELDVKLPFALHPAIYDSLAAGEVVPPQVAKHEYDEKDVIESCEWLVQLRFSRASKDVGPYGYLECDKLSWDPDSKRYIDPNCRTPLYRYEHWDFLFVLWGPDAKAFPQHNLDPEAAVPQGQAAQYTEALCRRVYDDRYVAPVRAIVQGFQKIVTRRSLNLVFRTVVGRQMQVMIEGREKELEFYGSNGILEAIRWEGNWTAPSKERMVQALGKLQDHQELDRLRMFVRFVTGKVMPPIGGWKELKQRAGEGKGLWLTLVPNTCTFFNFRSRNCFNRLVVPTDCVEERAPLFDNLLAAMANGQQS